MTPEAFIAKWRGVELSERAASQDHFNELCALLDVKKPTDADARGAWFTFERPVPGGGKGGVLSSTHAGHVSHLRRGLCEAVGLYVQAARDRRAPRCSCP